MPNPDSFAVAQRPPTIYRGYGLRALAGLRSGGVGSAGPRRAVVLGAGIAGLCAAAALRHAVDTVVVLERDPLDEKREPAPRRGVPQSSQLHNLLGAAQANLEALLPGFLDALAAAGAMRGRVSADTHVYELGLRMPERDLGLAIVCARRPVIEHAARRMLLEDQRVRVQDGTVASGVVIERGAIRGVLAEDTAAGRRELIDAELVVDATGTGSQAPRWLAAAGYEVPEQVRSVSQWYASALYRRPPDTGSANRFWLVFPTPPQTRGGLASPVDRATVNVSLNGGAHDMPPRTNEEFGAYARSLEDPVIAELMASATPVAVPTVFRRMFAFWRHFEEMTVRPAGFLPIGDAFATLNPLFGQGMSVAAKQGAALAEVARASALEDVDELTRRYVGEAAAVVQQAWELGTLVDSRTGWSRVVSDRHAAMRLGRLLADDPDLHRTYVAIWHLLEPATALESPTVLHQLGSSAP